MSTALDQLLQERHQWRLMRWRRKIRVNERCSLGWRRFCKALHREVVQHNALGRPMLGIRMDEHRVEVHHSGRLEAVLAFELDTHNAQITYRSPMHTGSAFLHSEGSITANFIGSMLVLDASGHMVKYGYEEAAKRLMRPLVSA